MEVLRTYTLQANDIDHNDNNMPGVLLLLSATPYNIQQVHFVVYITAPLMSLPSFS